MALPPCSRASRRQKIQEDLDRWEKLNIDMDALAKQVLLQPQECPTQTTSGEPWSIWIQNVKLVKNISNRIQDHIHGQEAIQYWIRKGKFQDGNKELMNWDSIGTAIQTVHKTRLWFISKHASAMCGVGKLTKIQGDSETADCPRCGTYEDTPHVWCCKAPSAQSLWLLHLEKFFSWLVTLDMDPEISSSLVSELKN